MSEKDYSAYYPQPDPSNGGILSPIELIAMWQRECTDKQVIDSLEDPLKLHEHLMTNRPNSIPIAGWTDAMAAERILRAAMAENINPEPPDGWAPQPWSV